ncbi:MAG TPA: ABC transporter ATP-binding protein [Acidimicrobiia bacterium]
MGETVLELRGISKSFGALKVIDDLTLHVEEGEAVGIVGPNGAGKTTMFNLISGELLPDAGSIEFDRLVIISNPSYLRARRGIGRTFQIPQPFNGLTVFENVVVGYSFGNVDAGGEGHEQCAEILRATGLLPRANDAAGTLTLLERKRLELARALATGPRVLLLDEIAGGLTEHEVDELVELIRSIRAGGVSIVWIEHVVNALLAVVDRLVAIHYGRNLIEGNPHEVMSSPQVREVYLGIEE